MIRQGGLCLSKKDLKLFQVVEQCRAGELTQDQAASKLEISVRTLQRKTTAIRKKGIEGLIHGNRVGFLDAGRTFGRIVSTSISP